MTTDQIDLAFRQAIYVSGAWRAMRITRQHQLLLRYHLKKGIPISLNKKLRLLQRTGWRQPEHSYTHRQLVEAVRFALKASAAAQAHGAEYLVEKYLGA